MYHFGVSAQGQLSNTRITVLYYINRIAYCCIKTDFDDDPEIEIF